MSAPNAQCAEFSTLPLPSSLLEGLSSLGLLAPTPVQARSLPPILAGRDVLVRSETGSGKTVAFGLGMLAALGSELRVQALALCPTRELAEQVSHEIRRLARRTPNVKVLSLGGGVPFAPQRASLQHGAHIVIGTPGRIEEHVRKGSLTLEHIKVLVLDEADRMLDMGFEPQIAKVVQHAPAARQTLLFSASYPPAISGLSAAYQRDALRILVEDASFLSAERDREASAPPGTAQRLVQHFIRVPESRKLSCLADWLAHARPESTLVFCNTRAECAAVAEQLGARGWVAASIHGDLAQRERQHALRLFVNGSCSVLAATDVAARGWDIPDLSLVANLGLSRDPTVHLHRIGRTGRAGALGRVVNIVSDQDRFACDAIERTLGAPVWAEPPAPSSLPPPAPRRATLLLSAAKDKKLRPGDILGALTAQGGIEGSAVGLIQIADDVAYVAIDRAIAERALEHLRERRIKGRSVKVRKATLELRPAALVLNG